MLCPKCYANIEDGLTVCPQCGASLAEEAAAPAPAVNPDAVAGFDAPAEVPAGPVDKKTFFKTIVDEKLRKNVVASAIICYVVAALTAVSALTQGVYATLIDVAVILILGIIIHKTQSLAASIVLLVYSIIEVVLALIMTGTPAGWLLIVAGICAVIYTSKFNKAWKEFKANNG